MTVKTKNGRTTKMYDMNIKRKTLLKKRREKALQNAKDRKSAKKNLLTAIKANRKVDRALKDTQSGRKPNDELINGSNADTITPVDNIDNIEIVAKNVGNAAINAEKIDTDSTNRDNIDVVPPQSWGDRSDTKHSKCLLLGGRRLNQLTLIPKPKGSGGARAATAQVGPANKRNDTKRCLPIEASLRPGEAVPW